MGLKHCMSTYTHFLEVRTIKINSVPLSPSLFLSLNSVSLSFQFSLTTGHFLSDKNVVDRLKRKGYTVQHIPVSQHLEGYVTHIRK